MNETSLSPRVSQILESIRDAFVACDRDLCITYVNGRMARFWNLPASDIVGMPLQAFTDRFHDDGYTHRMFQAALDTGRPVTYENRFEERWFETRLFPFSDGVAGYTRDITLSKTEQRRVLELNLELERRVAERTVQLEEANKELESFAYSVSHDLRAPLRAIDGFSQALIEDYGADLDERAQVYLDRVRKAAQRMGDLIDALLRLSLIARATIVCSHLDVTQIANAVVEDLRDGEPERSIEVEVARGMRAFGDRQLLHAVYQNLIGNAWKFTRNTAHPRIEAGKTSDGEFYVRDNGAGFDMAYSKKLFGPFQRLHSAGEYEGTGIGLATVAHAIHRHGGTICAFAEVGAGATFFFTLPEPRAQNPA